MNQFVIFEFPAARLVDVLEGRVTVSNLPSGAVLRSWWREQNGPLEEQRDVICLKLEHESFLPVALKIPRVVAELRETSRKPIGLARSSAA